MKNNNYEQLFTELTPEEGSTISGGFEYKLLNDTDKKVYFYTFDDFFDSTFRNLEPGKDVTLTYPGERLYVLFDNKRGDGRVTPEVKELSSGGTYRFSLNNDDLAIVQGYQLYIYTPQS